MKPNPVAVTRPVGETVTTAVFCDVKVAATALQLRIVGGSDTLRIAGEQVLFQLVTDPVTSGYTVSWSSSQTSRLLPLGLGRFQVISIPAVATTVEISAALGANVATRNIVLVPAP